MRAFACLVFAVALQAAVSNVRVGGVTPTQAVLVWVGPSATACTLEVSESATYSPFAHDVNTALFAGSSADSRAGNVTSGRERTFVVGKRGCGNERRLRHYNASGQGQPAHLQRERDGGAWTWPKRLQRVHQCGYTERHGVAADICGYTVRQPFGLGEGDLL